ncbi:lipopolysaccharide biosynthesis protein [Mucilaginibacter limnophilus]|uniref:Lipopolysaccharide biosynthesis protein n=1 Tax=Mucilaginibacter limnophilus TaxID=1932778 RepID=A0A437MQ26_9SPHI|nr:lipopolysaccharide biosynthesis protein [Mucilaginibacter limnophilus]RVT99752.1 lipopolysaccharide biosynthesis protein [Mucilaginibacter limnophilus]
MANIRKQSVTAFLWSGLGQYVNMGLSFLTAAVLGRLLAPTDFGLVGMIVTINSFLLIFANTGLSTTIVQHKEFGKDEHNSLFTLGLVSGVIASSILALLAPAIAIFYKDDRLTMVALSVSPTFLLTALTQVPQGILQKQLKFKLLSIATVSSALLSSLIAVYLAYIGWGYWSLIMQLLLRAFLLLTFCIYFSRQAISLKWTPSLYKKIYNFTGNLTLFQVVNYFQRNLDNILIGRNFGAASLGIYSRAYLIMTTFNSAIGGVISSVLHPTLSKKQDDIAAMTRGYGEIVQYILWLSCPVMGLCAAFAPQFIHIVWGANWHSVVPSFFWLALAGMHQPVYITLGAVFASRFQTKSQFYCGVVTTALLVLAIILGLPYGIVGVARAYSIMSHLIFFPYMYFVWCKVLQGRFQAFLRLVLPPMLFGWTLLLITILTTNNDFPAFINRNFQFSTAFIIAGLAWLLSLCVVFLKRVYPSVKKTLLS